MAEAKGEATYIVEPTNANIDASNGFTVRKRFKDTETITTYTTNVTTMFDDILDQMTRPTASGSTMKGGTLFLKNGTYSVETSKIIAGDATDGANVHLRIIGESRERTILKAGFVASSEILEINCSTDIENITFNGNSNAGVNGITSTSTTDTKTLKVKNCRFTNIENFGLLIQPTNTYGFELSHSLFDNHQTSEDQCAFSCEGWAHIHDNVFDKRVGTVTGELLTSGTCVNTNIHDNICLGDQTTNPMCISLEWFTANANYDNIFIHDNSIYNGKIRMGSVGDASPQIGRNITISNNHLYHGTIQIRGPTSGAGDTLKDVHCVNNSFIDPWEGAISLLNVSGYCVISDNTIKNSNMSNNAITFDKGCISLDTGTDVVCQNNNLYMASGGPANSNPYGIRYIGMVNPTIRNNRIINRTANSSYVDAGSNSGTKLISRSL